MRAPTASLDDLAASAPERIDQAVMVQRWDSLTFIHRPCDPEVVQKVLPRGLEVDTFDGAAWIGLVPFRLTVRGPRLPALPWVSRFAEVNIRTYVRGPDGRRGIWFLSLDAARLGAVVIARRWYRIPYVWGVTRLTETPRTVRYQSTRRWPRPAGAELRLTVAPSEPIAPPDVTELERFLTCRWRLYSPAPLALPATRIRFVATQVEHPRRGRCDVHASSSYARDCLKRLASRGSAQTSSHTSRRECAFGSVRDTPSATRIASLPGMAGGRSPE